MPTETATPMLRQYQKIKARHKDCILFFRLGDFYEMFYDDAREASQILELVLTSRGKGTANQVPMCGIPYHAADNYIHRLIRAGRKVAICEQIEDPATAKGIVTRDVIRVISSGTYIDENSTDARYLACVVPQKQQVGLAFIDPADGTIRANQYKDSRRVQEILSRLPICECIFPAAAEETVARLLDHPHLKTKTIVRSPHEDWAFNPDIAGKTLCEHLGVMNLHGFGLGDLPGAIAASGALLEYLRQMNKQPLRHIDKLARYTDDDYLVISPAAVYGLDMERLLQTLNGCVTAMGKRQLRHWMFHPLKNPDDIRHRQQGVTLLKDSPEMPERLPALLKRIPDTEKALSKLSCGYLHPKDVLAVRQALTAITDLQPLIAALAARNDLFTVDDIPQLRQTLEAAINPDMPLSKSEGKVIRPSYHDELDNLRDIQQNGRQWLQEFQRKEIQRTGINSLKVGFNKVFGYYIEVTRTHSNRVPDDYIRKQTLVNAERFITPDLKEYEEKILTAQDRILHIEQEVLCRMQQLILDASLELHRFCRQVATIDVLYALACLARQPGYTAPDIGEDMRIDIREGRHPVVEKATDGHFEPNDTLLDDEDNHFLILTGPNMAGKSTYIRQIALLTILAQVGSYVPAAQAHIGVVDKIFTRIGAHDDIVKGQSTFMVEMTETADILHNLTDRSLVILDEIGRGTSTYDGLSLAWALAEHFCERRARTLFATHFHELTVLADEYPGVRNYNVAVKEWRDEIIFLHKIVPGSTDDSYGIYVAKLAGVPAGVIQRARRILSQLERQGGLKERLTATSRRTAGSNDDTGNIRAENQLNFLEYREADPIWEEIQQRLAATDINHLTPIAALHILQEMKTSFHERCESLKKDT